MKVIGFAGYSGAGKTTLVEALVALLRGRGLKVSVVKHAHHRFDVDRAGKDSWRHRQAGAYEVLLASDRRLALMREFERPMELSVRDMLAELDPAVDWVLIEGFKHGDMPKIEVWRAQADRLEQGKSTAPLYPHDTWVLAVATDDAAALPLRPLQPVLDLNRPELVLQWLLERGEQLRYGAHAPSVSARRQSPGILEKNAMQEQRKPLKPLDEALQELLAQAQVLAGAEQVDTFDADGRVLLQDAVSPLQVPPQDNSAMDGYAVRAAECAGAMAGLPVSQRIPAGTSPQPLLHGTAARIFTGAPVPAGADAIVMQEDCDVLDDGRVRIKAQPRAGQWIRRAGEDITLGATVIAAGTRLTPAHLGLAASMGNARLQVARKPRVALFSTGDELVMPGSVAPQDMQPGSIYNSNRFFLRALLMRVGCEVTDLGIVPDDREATLKALAEAARGHDVIVTSGGVSVGEEDHVKPAVQQLGRLDLWQINIKPGKPFAYGRVSRGGDEFAHFIGLPGNPVSGFVTFLVLVRPFLLRLQGVAQVQPRAIAARADFSWPKGDKRREFLRVRYNDQGGLELFGNQSSGVLTSTAWGDGVVDNPASTTIAPGDTVRFIPFSELMA